MSKMTFLIKSLLKLQNTSRLCLGIIWNPLTLLLTRLRAADLTKPFDPRNLDVPQLLASVTEFFSVDMVEFFFLFVWPEPTNRNDVATFFQKNRGPEVNDSEVSSKCFKKSLESSALERLLFFLSSFNMSLFQSFFCHGLWNSSYMEI